MPGVYKRALRGLGLWACLVDVTCVPAEAPPAAEVSEYRPTPVLASVDDISAIVHAVADRIKNPPPQTYVTLPSRVRATPDGRLRVARAGPVLQRQGLGVGVGVTLSHDEPGQ